MAQSSGQVEVEDKIRVGIAYSGRFRPGPVKEEAGQGGRKRSGRKKLRRTKMEEGGRRKEEGAGVAARPRPLRDLCEPLRARGPAIAFPGPVGLREQRIAVCCVLSPALLLLRAALLLLRAALLVRDAFILCVLR